MLDGDKLLISELSAASISKYADEGVITDGMKVKVDAALASAENLGRAVYIASWAADINDILNKKTGTQILPSALTNTKSTNTDLTKGNAGEVQ